MSAPSGAVRATNARQWVIFYAVTLAVITYVDRVCISKSAEFIMRDLHLTKIQMGYAFTAFGWAYALFEIPGGWLGDKIGPRRVLMRVVMMWSVFTIATGWAWGLGSLVFFRFLFGIGEAGCFPNLTKAFTLWLPVQERVRAQGIMWLSARWGGAFTPLLVGWMLTVMEWRYTFLTFGLLGTVWAWFFYSWFRDNPKDHPAVNAAELAHIGDSGAGVNAHASVPWQKLLASRTAWLLWGQYFAMSYGWYFYVTWFPTYLKEEKTFAEMSNWQLTMMACVPLFFGGLGSIFCGLISGPLSRGPLGLANTRRLMGFLGLAGAGGLLLFSTFLSNPFLAVLAIGLASFCNDLAMPGGWGACMDVGGRHTGSLSGSMNMMGNAGGAVAPMAVPLILAATNNNWSINFYVFAAVYGLGALCWVFIDPVTPLEKADELPLKLA